MAALGGGSSFSGTYVVSPPVVFPPPELGNVVRLGLVYGEDGLTPVRFRERNTMQRVRVEQGPKALERYARVVQRPAQDTVTAAIMAEDVGPTMAQGRLQIISVPAN